MANIYERFFTNTCSNTRKRITRKLKDSNTLKSNIANPHYRTIIIKDIPRLAFAYEYGRNFARHERCVVGNMVISPIFHLKTMKRLVEVFPDDAVIRVVSSGRTTIIVPWLKLLYIVKMNL